MHWRKSSGGILRPAEKRRRTAARHFEKIAFVGPYTNNHEIKSSWSFTGDSKDCVTIQEAAEKVFDASRTTYAEGCPVIGNDVELIGFTETTPKKYSEEELAAMEQSALQAAKRPISW